MGDLSNFSISELAAELSKRSDLLGHDGTLELELYKLGNKIKPNVTSDSFAIRRNGKRYEGGMIRRGSLLQDIGKLVPIGGNVRPGETRLTALIRHWMTDLGHEVVVIPGWERWPYESCYGPPDMSGKVRAGFDGIDSTKYSMSNTWLVLLAEPDKPFVYGVGPGGREAQEFVWGVTFDTPDEEFGYGMGPVFKACLARHKKEYGW